MYYLKKIAKNMGVETPKEPKDDEWYLEKIKEKLEENND